MKKTIQLTTFIVLLFIEFASYAQSAGNFTRVAIRDSISLGGTWIKDWDQIKGSGIDSIRYDPATGIFYGRKTTGGEIVIPTGMVDSLATRLTAPQADIRYKALTYVPDWAEVINKPNSFVPSSHTHPASQITDFASAARTLLSGTAPITYNSTTGAIGWSGSTTDVTEGMRLYYSNARVQSFADTRYTPLTRSIAVGTGMTGGGDLTADRAVGLDYSYLDDRYLSGYKQRAAVRVATIANITLSGTQTIDAVAVVSGDRVLVKNQTTGSQNGIYIVAAAAWSRAGDFDATTAGEIEQGSQIFVNEGTINNKTGWSLSTGGPIVVGTTALVFIQYAGANNYVAGIGLALSGNTFSAQTGTALWNANKIQGIGVSTAPPTSGQLLKFDGTNYAAWTPDYLTGELDLIAQSKTVSVNAGTGISVTGSAQSVGSNPAFTVALNATTTNINEGINLYWTTARGDARYPLLTGAYANPTWLTSLPWSKITGAPTFLTANQLITLTGDITGSGTTGITTTLKNTGTAGTYTKVTTDAAGRVTVGTSLSATDIPLLDWAKINTGKPSTMAGYGITDATPSNRSITISAGAGITISTATQDLSANRTWTITAANAPTHTFVTAVSSDITYTVLGTDKTILADNGASLKTVNVVLPVASTNSDRIITIKRTSSACGIVYLSVSGSGKIDNSTSWAMQNSGEAITMQSDGTKWQIINAFAGSQCLVP
jgi:hypothetical protein